jgi:hypothetical protein
MRLLTAACSRTDAPSQMRIPRWVSFVVHENQKDLWALLVHPRLGQSSARVSVAAREPRAFALSIVTNPGNVSVFEAPSLSELAESIVIGLRALGYDVELVPYGVHTTRRQIVLNPNAIPILGLPDPRPDAILYNAEHFSQDARCRLGSLFGDSVLEFFARHEVWDFNDGNAEKLRAHGVERATYMPPAYVPALTRVPRLVEDIDVLFLGTYIPRRQRILDELKTRGVRVEAPNQSAAGPVVWRFGKERDELIARAKIVLNMHSSDIAKNFETVRVSYLLANGRFVISEHSGTEPWAGGYLSVPYDKIADACVEYLARPDERERIAAHGFELFSTDTMAARLAAALGTPAKPSTKESSPVAESVAQEVVEYVTRVEAPSRVPPVEIGKLEHQAIVDLAAQHGREPVCLDSLPPIVRLLFANRLSGFWRFLPARVDRAGAADG